MFCVLLCVYVNVTVNVCECPFVLGVCVCVFLCGRIFVCVCAIEHASIVNFLVFGSGTYDDDWDEYY